MGYAYDTPVGKSPSDDVANNRVFEDGRSVTSGERRLPDYSVALLTGPDMTKGANEERGTEQAIT